MYFSWYDESEASNADDKHLDALDKLREFYALLLNAVRSLCYCQVISKINDLCSLLIRTHSKIKVF